MREHTTVGPRVLDALWAVALVSAALVIVYVLTSDTPGAGVRAVVLVAGLVVLQALWTVRRRRGPHLALTAALVLVCLVVGTAGDVVLALYPLFVAIIVVILDAGPRVGAVVVAALLAFSIVGYLTTGRSDEYVVVQMIATSTIFLFVYVTGVLIHRSTAESAQRAELLAELDAAHTELRAGIETEKEYVLAQERARSARELHDGLGHRLTLIGMSLDFAERARESAPDRAWAEVAGARDAARDALAEMRLWVRALDPVPVAGLTGIAALDAVADAFRGTGVDVRLDVEGEERPVPRDVLLFAHRFVQEGLTNALRHARAKKVAVTVAFGPGELELALADDGHGTAPEHPGYGLRSLSERAAALGGELRIDEADSGVRIRATVPLNDGGSRA